MEMGNKAMLVVLAMVVVAVHGQEDCTSALMPCSDYLGSENPPASCCEPIKKAVATQLTCLCELLHNEGLFESLNINRTQALELPKKCGITDAASNCDATSLQGHHGKKHGHHAQKSASAVASPSLSASAIVDAPASAPLHGHHGKDHGHHATHSAPTAPTSAPTSAPATSSPSASPNVVAPAPGVSPNVTGASHSGVGKLAWSGMTCWVVFLSFMVVV
ncbi:hypothetical protein NE237_028495 [Protea cynaroides]|uniref:Bifunctional inhibitor/plant lipid transfer protein/seed storage helical domain-containing protein n=1 Tax=Protea cynaroides TaxID=273540 RepID=A0A9Q0JVC0_9MAGN|nr:hypothetical protein NE237_028495 [Protea cynaroides]